MVIFHHANGKRDADYDDDVATILSIHHNNNNKHSCNNCLEQTHKSNTKNFHFCFFFFQLFSTSKIATHISHISFSYCSRSFCVHIKIY